MRKQETQGEYMREKKEGFIEKVIVSSIVAIVTALTTGMVTNFINQKEIETQEKKIKHDMSQLQSTSISKSSEQLNLWIQKYEKLDEKYQQLRENHSRLTSTSTNKSSFSTSADNTIKVKSPTASVAGNWYTPDGTVQWQFGPSTVSVSGIGLAHGLIGGEGSYNRFQNQISGTINLHTMFYIPVKEKINFTSSVNNDRTIITGTYTDNTGEMYNLSLFRQ